MGDNSLIVPYWQGNIQRGYGFYPYTPNSFNKRTKSKESTHCVERMK